MRVLADTNILARLAQPAHHQHQNALNAVEVILARSDDPCIVPQAIYEFWVVATRPASANGLNMTIQQTQTEIAKAKRIFTLLRDERAIFKEWERLVWGLGGKGKRANDCGLVAG